MAFAKLIGTPKATKYKGSKYVGQQTIQTKKVYGFHQVNNNNKSKSPKPKTPLKTARNQLNKTPIKSNQKNMTETKGTRLSTTPNRPGTARK